MKSKLSLGGLAEVISEQTMAEGPELMALTFLVAAAYADMVGRKDIGDHFVRRSHEVYPPSTSTGGA